MSSVKSPPSSRLQILGEEELTALTPLTVDSPTSLGELLDVQVFRDVCVSFVDLYKVGLKIFDADGSKLIDIRVGNADWCGYIFEHHSGKKQCTQLVRKIKSHSYRQLEEGKIAEQECFSGLKYIIMPVSYAGDTLGRVVYGPYLPARVDGPGAAVYSFGEGFDTEKLWAFRRTIRRLPDETMFKIVENFRTVIDTVVLSAMKSVMTQKIHVESITLAYNDLTEANIRLKESLDKLKELDRMKSNFLAMISHELKTPLTSVIGYSEMILEGMAGDINEEQRDYISTIKEKGDALLELIGNLLDMSRIEAGALSVDAEELDIQKVARAACSSVVPQARKKDVKMDISLSDSVPTIKGDVGKIQQCVVNLLGNAVKFTSEGGTVSLRTSLWMGQRRSASADRFAAEEEFVRIEVKDTGIGIPAEKLEAVFNRFYQADGSITRKFGGTGLGLSIVRQFIEAHGGEVWAESVLGEGATFIILLPVVWGGDIQVRV